MRRVAHLVPSLEFGGIQTQLASLVLPLRQRGWDTSVIAFGDGPVRARFDALAVPVAIVEPPSVRVLRRPVLFARQIRLGRRAVEAVRAAQGAQVTHSHVLGNLHAMLPAGQPLVASLHNERLLPAANGKGAVVRAAHVALLRHTVARARVVIAVSQAVASAAAETGVTRDVEVVCNGVDVERFALGPGASTFRRELGIPPTALVVAAVGRLAAQKGYAYLLDAWRSISAASPTAHLVIIGDGPLEETLRRRCAGLGLRAVHLCGPRSDVPQVLADSDLVVSAADHEGLPNSLLEAMAAARAVVVTAVGGVPEVVRDGTDGALVPRGDPHALADAVLDLLADASRRAELGSAARARVSERFDITSTADRLAALYERAWDGPPR